MKTGVAGEEGRWENGQEGEKREAMSLSSGIAEAGETQKKDICGRREVWLKAHVGGSG